MNKGLPSREFLDKMFSLSQETHPERLYVLDRLGPEGNIIYDLGCGGHKSTPRAIGVDILPCTDIQASIDDLPIYSETADILISRHSLEHLIDPIKALVEWKRILKPGGKIILVLPDYGAIDTMHPVLGGGMHLHAFTKESLERLVGYIPGLVFKESPFSLVVGWSIGCVIEKAPILSPDGDEGDLDDRLSILDIRNRIEKKENFNFVRVGDGEIQCMAGVNGHNCDFQSYSPRLQAALKESLSFLGKVDNTYFSRWKLDGPEQAVISSLEEELGIRCTENHDLLMHRVGEITSEHYELWKTIKKSPRRKIFVGPERLSGVMSFLNIDIMTVVPQHEAFDRLFDPEVLDNDIWLFSAGLAAKAWIGEVVKKNPNVTCIDTGSAFDPIFVGRTRTCQLSQEYLKAYYKDLL